MRDVDFFVLKVCDRVHSGLGILIFVVVENNEFFNFATPRHMKGKVNALLCSQLSATAAVLHIEVVLSLHI